VESAELCGEGKALVTAKIPNGCGLSPKEIRALLRRHAECVEDRAATAAREAASYGTDGTG